MAQPASRRLATEQFVADASTEDRKRSNHTGQQTVDTLSDATSVGKNVIRAADQATARAAIGAGTSSLALGTTGTTAAAGNHTHTAAAVGAVEGGNGITKIVKLTQAAYDALGTKDAATLYVIQG